MAITTCTILHPPTGSKCSPRHSELEGLRAVHGHHVIDIGQGTAIFGREVIALLQELDLSSRDPRQVGTEVPYL